MKKYLLALTCFAIVSACTYQNEEELFPEKDACEIGSVTYSLTVEHTLMHNCYSCHSSGFPSGGVTLDTYAGVKQVAQSGRLFGAINHLPGYHPMPRGGAKLPACEIAQIKAWIDAGALNN